MSEQMLGALVTATVLSAAGDNQRPAGDRQCDWPCDQRLNFPAGEAPPSTLQVFEALALSPSGARLAPREGMPGTPGFTWVEALWIFGDAYSLFRRGNRVFFRQKAAPSLAYETARPKHRAATRMVA